MYLTIELYGPVTAVRVAFRQGGLGGDWFAIDDAIQTRQQFQASHALPGYFRQQALCTLRPGTVLNVGRCSSLFGQPGGGFQAEFLDGPLPQVFPISGMWSNRAGNA